MNRRGKPRRFHNDFETFSLVNLPDVGLSKYARHPSTEALMLSYAVDDDEVGQWVPAEGELLPAIVEDCMEDERVIKYGWNANFEKYIWEHTLGIKTEWEHWRDPMVMAHYCSMPGKLSEVGPIVKLPMEDQKKGYGTRLINWFCKLRPATKTKPARRVYFHEKPDLWDDFKVYNVNDTKAERGIFKRLEPYDLPPEEWEMWFLDQRINEAGIPVNVDMVNNAISIRDELMASKMAQMRHLTGLENPNSRDQLLHWLQNHGYPYYDLQAAHKNLFLDVEKAKAGVAAHRVLQLHKETSRQSTKKYDSLKSHVESDGRIRFCFQFMGAARTGRWGGRVVQPHNLTIAEPYLQGLKIEKTPAGHKRIVGGIQVELAGWLEKFDAEVLEWFYGSPMDVLAAGVRPVVQAPPGWVFVDADLNAIENRVLGWIANDDKILGVFKKGRDPYVDFAVYLYREPYEKLFAEYKSGNKTKRTIAKPGVLGCGYKLSAGTTYIDPRSGEEEASGLMGYARNMGINLTQPQADHSVSTWRDTFIRTVDYWAENERAARRCVAQGAPTEAGPLRYDLKGPFLRMRLPSGRHLHYVRPKLMDWLMPWGDYRRTLTYEGLDDRHQWTRMSTHAGKLVENPSQGIARDVLAHGMRLAIREGLGIVLHVHDQAVGLVRERDAEEALTLLIQCLVAKADWMDGLPLAAAGHISKWFVKD